MAKQLSLGKLRSHLDQSCFNSKQHRNARKNPSAKWKNSSAIVRAARLERPFFPVGEKEVKEVSKSGSKQIEVVHKKGPTGKKPCVLSERFSPSLKCGVRRCKSCDHVMFPSKAAAPDIDAANRTLIRNGVRMQIEFGRKTHFST